jgi:predicted RNA-binding protein YlxR (DUF448 family)
LSDPLRTCIGCGERGAQQTLVRFVSAGGGLVLDEGSARQPGRGAYLHRTPACWNVFARRRGPVRSLRMTPGVAQREQLVDTLSSMAAEVSR